MHFIKIPTTLYHMFLSSVAYYLYRINRLRLMSKPMLCKGIRSECNFSFYFVLVKNKKYKQKISVILIESYSLAKYFVRSLTGFRSNRLTHDFCREKARERERGVGREGEKNLLKFNFFVRVLIHLCAEARERKKERERQQKNYKIKLKLLLALRKFPNSQQKKKESGEGDGEGGSGAATSRKAARKILNRIKMHSSSNDTDTAKKKRAKSGQEQQAETQRGGK